MCFAEIFADCVPSKAMLGYQDWRSNIEWGISWDIAGKMNGDWRRQLWLNRTCFREGMISEKKQAHIVMRLL